MADQISPARWPRHLLDCAHRIGTSCFERGYDCLGCDSVQARDLFMSLVLGHSKISSFLLTLQETFQVID
jgi:hypothetical protein